MTPTYSDPLVTLFEGDCLPVMRELPAESVDAVVCDPPYFLRFMGRKWDDSDSPQHQEDLHKAWATEAFRVLKPGGYLVAFGGTRTVHRLASGIEDAGFEIRDELVWIYASGFPKSLDVSKALDKTRDDRPDNAGVQSFLDAARLMAGLTLGDVNRHFGFATTGSNNAGHWMTNPLSRSVPTWDQWLQLKELLRFDDEMDAEVWRLNGRKGKPGEAWDQREVTGTRSRKGKPPQFMWEETAGQNWNETTGATDLARKWEGWGTALKPAHEPIVMARKPLVGTVAANVTRYGTGALNIDGTRIGTTGGGTHCSDFPEPCSGHTGHGRYSPTVHVQSEVGGRWPSNVLLDPDSAALFDEPNPWVVGSGATTTSQVTRTDPAAKAGTMFGGAPSNSRSPEYLGDTGGYSRFFIIPKADRQERERGLAKHIDTGNGVDGDRIGTMDDAPPGSLRRANTHPTVKPIDLMRHLVKLVTPPGGTVLDPFAGSGTTLLAASELGIKSIGIEREPEYMEIIKGRLMATPMGLGLDVPAGTKRRKLNIRDNATEERHRTPIRDPYAYWGERERPPLDPDEEPAA